MNLDSAEKELSVEPNPPRPPVICRNCGHHVHDKYCPRCGQHFADHNHGLWQFVAEFCEEFVRLDSKFFRTIVPLCIRPGFLTKEWVAGKRVRYITPLKLYLTLSALCFLMISLQPASGIVKSTSDGKSTGPVVIEGIGSSAESDIDSDQGPRHSKASEGWFTDLMNNSV